MMHHLSRCLPCGVVGLALLTASGCDSKPAPASAPAKPAQSAPASPSASPASPASHAGTGSKMDDHDHQMTSLGTTKIGAWDVKVAGEVKPGKEGHFDIELSGSTDKPAAIRVWIGSQDARGAMKQKADGDGKEFHAHADVPNPIPDGAGFWIEIEDAKGVKTVGGVPLKH